MIIPIKCFTCGKVIADKYRYYQCKVRQQKIDKSQLKETNIYFTNENQEKAIEGYVLDDLNIKDLCCRRHFLTHVDIE